MKNTEKHGKSRYIGMNIRKMLKNQRKLQVIRNPLQDNLGPGSGFEPES
jgi:hypothetical protein